MGEPIVAVQADSDAPAPRPREQALAAGIQWLAVWTLRWLIIGIGALAVGYVVQTLWSILLPLILALILTTVLQPLASFLEQRLGLPSSLAAAGAVLSTIGAIAAFVMFIIPSVASEIGEIADSASLGLTKIEEWVSDSGRFDVTEMQVDAGISAVQERLQSSSASIASGVLVGVSAVTAAAINLVLTLVLSFFFLKDGRRFLPWLDATAGPRVGQHLTEVLSRAWMTLGGFVRTQALVGLIDAVLIGAGLLIVGVPLAIPLAALTFLAAFAPIVGAVVVGGLAALVALVANGWVAALIVVVIVLVVQQLEGNLFLPYLQGKSLNLHAAIVLLAIVLGSTLFGVAGAFLSVPTVAVLAVVLRYINEVCTDAEQSGDPPARPSGAENQDELLDQAADEGDPAATVNTQNGSD